MVTRRSALGLGIGLSLWLVRKASAWARTPMPMLITPPKIAGTLSHGSKITATRAVWNAGTSTGQWHRDGVPIRGATGLTYIYNETTDDGTYLTFVETNGTATATSNALITGENLVLYSTSFAAAERKPINGYDGWVLGGNEDKNTYWITDNSMAMVEAAFGSEHGVAREMGTGNLNFEATLFVDPTSDPSRKDRRIGVRYIDHNNYVTLRIHANGLKLTRKVAGSDTSLLSVTNGAYASANGRRVSLRASGNYVRVFLDGEEIEESVAANQGLGFDITGATGTKIMVNGQNDGSTPPHPIKIFTDVVVRTLPASEIFISSSTVEQSLGGDVVARLVGTFSGSIKALQILVLSRTGQVICDWDDATGINGSTFNVTTGALPIEEQGTENVFWLRDKANHKVASRKVQAVGHYAALAPMQLGLNETFYAYWGAGDQIRDYGQRATWINGDFSAIPHAHLDPATLLPISYPAGQTSLIARNTVRQRYGVYDITYPPSMRFVELAPGTQNTTVTTKFRNGTGQLTVTDIGTVRIKFNGPIPAGGANITMKPVGDRSTKIYTDQMLDDYTGAGFRIVRYMTPTGINVSAPGPLTATNRLVPVDGAGRACTVEHMVEFCNDANCHLWFNIHHQADDSWISYHAAYIAAHLNSGLKCYVELSNELWNSFPQGQAAFVYGNRAGYYNTNGDAGPRTIINVDSSGPDATAALNSSTGYPNTSYPRGTFIMGNLSGSGWQIWQALTTTPIGASGIVPATGSNLNWKVVANFAGVVRAARRWAGVRSAEAFDLFDAEFANPRDRIIRVIGIQATDSVAAVMERIGFQGVYLKTDRIAAAPYWGGGVGGINLGRYGSSHIAGFGATEKALYATDVAAWKNALFSVANTAIDATISSQVKLKNALETALRQSPYNLSPNAIQYCSYECNHHIVLTGYPDGALAQAAFRSFRQDRRLGDATTYYLNKIKESLGGEHIFFDSVTADEPATAGWGIMNEQGDRSNPQYTAIAEWIAANA